MASLKAEKLNIKTIIIVIWNSFKRQFSKIKVICKNKKNLNKTKNKYPTLSNLYPFPFLRK